MLNLFILHRSIETQRAEVFQQRSIKYHATGYCKLLQVTTGTTVTIITSINSVINVIIVTPGTIELRYTIKPF